jgi:hypothetical protein
MRVSCGFGQYELRIGIQYTLFSKKGQIRIFSRATLEGKNVRNKGPLCIQT